MNLLKIPPHNKEAEQTVLGSIITGQNKIDENLNSDDFYFENHQTIFKRLKELKYIDLVSIANSLKINNDKINKSYLVELTNFAFQYKYNACLEIIKKKSEYRKILEATHKLEELSLKEKSGIEVLDKLNNQLQKIRAIDERDDVVSLKELSQKQKENYEERYRTGIPIIDNAIRGGVKSGDLVVISAPTGMGKTTLAQTLTYNFNLIPLPVLWFSYEVLGLHLWNKFKEMGIQDDFLAYIPLKHTTGNVGWIEQKIIEAKEKYFTKIVIIDHLGFLVPKTKISQSQNLSSYLGQITRELKILAIKHDIIIILPVHMRKTDKPTINDIRDSSGIAQEADYVITMNRELNTENSLEFYTPYSEIVLAKNRETGQNVKGWFYLDNNIFKQDYDYKGKQKKEYVNFN